MKHLASALLMIFIGALPAAAKPKVQTSMDQWGYMNLKENTELQAMFGGYDGVIGQKGAAQGRPNPMIFVTRIAKSKDLNSLQDWHEAVLTPAARNRIGKTQGRLSNGRFTLEFTQADGKAKIDWQIALLAFQVGDEIVVFNYQAFDPRSRRSLDLAKALFNQLNAQTFKELEAHSKSAH